MTRRLYLIARWSADHAIVVLLAWIAVLLALTALNNRLPPPGQQEIVLTGTDSAAAQTLLNRAFPGASSDAQPMVIACPTPLTSGSGKQSLDRLEHDVAHTHGVVGVTGPSQQPNLLSEDRQTAIVNIQVSNQALAKRDAARTILDTGQAAAPDCEVALGGLMGSSLSQPSTDISEVLGLIAAVVVLLITLRRIPAAAIPLLNAVIAVGIGAATVGLLGRLVFIPTIATTLGTMLGLGVGIDYALFLVIRHRLLLRRGFSISDSAGRTAGTAGAGIVFAGITLIVALTGLELTRIDYLAWLGHAAAIYVGVAILASMTFVPALFGLLKTTVQPKRHRGDHGDDHLDSTRWARVADAVTARPWRVAIGTALALGVLALPMTRMQFGQTDASSLPPTTTAYQANALITEGFGPGATGPLAVVLQLNRPATAPEHATVRSGEDPRAQDPRLRELHTTLEHTAGIVSVSQPIVSPDGGVAVLRVTPVTGPTDPATQRLIERLRDTVLPQATRGQDEVAHVGGATALMMDLTEQIGAALPTFILGVVLLSAILLLLAYRSLVIPVKAAAMNLLSISAAYGVVVAIFQFGWGAGLLGLDELVPIESYVPMMMFAVLFGLSMDYEVFLLTSFTEHFSRSGDMVTAVRRGLADTGEVVTAAATIMIVVFASFILVPDAVVKMFGVGLATAVLVDATIVRLLLVPSLMILSARWTWWLPGWLDRALPQLHVEGDPAQLESINEPAMPARPASVAEATRPATAILPVLLGVAVAWFLGSRMIASGPRLAYADVAVVISAVVGGLVVWLPIGVPGAGRSPGARIVCLLTGVVTVTLGYELFRAFIPYTEQNPGQLAAWALVLVAVVATATRARRYGLAVILGGVVMAVTTAVMGGANPATTTLLQVALVPALLAGLLALVFARLGVVFRPPPSPPAQPRDTDRELTGVAS